jgi:glycosyltransferase involved in cell wall biosynthesis
MKIILIPHLPTLYGRRFNLAKSLVSLGHEVHFITWDMPYPISLKGMYRHLINSGQSLTEKQSNGMYIHHVRRLPFFWPILNGILFKHQIRKMYHQWDIQVILSQSFTNETEPPLELPLIYDLNDDHLAYATVYGSIMYRLAYKMLQVSSTIKRQLTTAILVTAVSDILVEKAGLYNPNVLKIPNGIEKEVFRLNVTEQKHTIVYVSTFGKWSRVGDVIRAVDQIKETIPDVHLTLIGDGTDLPAAKRIIQEKNLDQWITVMGRVNDRQKVFERIARAEVCLNISEKNAFRNAASPMKVIDYSALGKKVVSSDLHEVKALHFPNVFIYSDESSNDSLETAIVDAFTRKVNRQQVQSLVRKNYQWQTLVDQIISNPVLRSYNK